MAQAFHDLLLAAGLLPSEAKVYLAARELGPSTAQHIAAKAGISRTATYEAIESLQRRGLLAVSTVGKKNLFVAEDPERIVSYIKGEQQRLQTTLQDVERSVEALRLLSGGIRPTMKVYEGEEALHAYFDHVASVNPKEWLEVTNADDVYSHIDEKVLLSARKSLQSVPGERVRVLYRGKARNPRAGVNHAQLDDSWGDFHGNIAIYDNYLAFVTYIGKTVAVIIESPAIAETMRVMFNMAWKTAKGS
ncbi:MAG: helix-turn-helix domain-containing protein [Patescibacteria group bacterium]